MGDLLPWLSGQAVCERLVVRPPSGCALAAGRGLERRFPPTFRIALTLWKDRAGAGVWLLLLPWSRTRTVADTLERQRGEALWAAAAWTRALAYSPGLTV